MYEYTHKAEEYKGDIEKGDSFDETIPGTIPEDLKNEDGSKDPNTDPSAVDPLLEDNKPGLSENIKEKNDRPGQINKELEEGDDEELPAPIDELEPECDEECEKQESERIYRLE